MFEKNPISSWLQLDDTPNSYPQAGMVPVINGAKNGFTFLNIASAAAFTSLQDTPNAYTGESLKYIRVNSGETGLEFLTGTAVLQAFDFTQLTPTQEQNISSNILSATANNGLVIDGGDALLWAKNLENSNLTLTGARTITGGANSFGITTTGGFTFTGSTITIDNLFKGGTGVEFTQQASNPGDVADNTIWINSSDGHAYRGAVDLEATSATTFLALTDTPASYTNGDIYYSNGSSVLALSIGTADQILAVNGAGTGLLWKDTAGGIYDGSGSVQAGVTTVTGQITDVLSLDFSGGGSGSSSINLGLNQAQLSADTGVAGETSSVLVGGDTIRFTLGANADFAINGSAGTSGQVLTSQGPNVPPIWGNVNALTFNDQANGLDIAETAGVVTVAYDFTELAQLATQDRATDRILIYDSSAASYDYVTLNDIVELPYQSTFITTDWAGGGPYTYTVTQATHGLTYSANEIFHVTITNASGDDITSTMTTINTDQTTGDVTITNASQIDGRIKIS